MQPEYIVEKWPFGWLFCAAAHAPGIPLTAISECQRLFRKSAVMDAGIAHHFKTSGRTDVVACVTTVKEGALWRKHIADSIAGLPREERWWRGTDVGMSSAAVFAVFCGDGLRLAVQQFGRDAVPADNDDFARCARLLDCFPEWRTRITEVGEAYPQTKWTHIVSRWAELESYDAATRSKVLREI